MTVNQVLKYFGNQNKTAKALGINRVAVVHWVKRNKVPAQRQLEIQKITKGKLKAGL
ncbi:Cro/CI family transcriptional regulator [Francisella philomiragia]|uniref:Helix-turn-helix domain-containing protein n=1 Tax=Francisella philomiragia TaxID=28110 RepID=A0ABS1GAI3_9GAMM|nr:Cro/CI family transcriptional regulator [Francisella philomiragia]MBK2258416.1 helix-turn-helix domain-containing protein [Francisella philomiragia]MBK2301786.1 helix-turn-helix domain-containing protein [Francisella philomiragia]